MLICLQLLLAPLWWNDDTTRYKLENEHSTCLSSFANSSESRVCSKQNAHAVIIKKHNQITWTEKLSLHMFCATVSIKSPEQKIITCRCSVPVSIKSPEQKVIACMCSVLQFQSNHLSKKQSIIKHLKDTRSWWPVTLSQLQPQKASLSVRQKYVTQP